MWTRFAQLKESAMKRILCVAGLLAIGVAAQAKIPAPVLDDAAKAKAAEAAAKTAWQGKLDAYQMCRAQDQVAAKYHKAAAAAGTDKPATPIMTPAVAASGTAPAKPPMAVVCADPGTFAYTSPDQKPLEASGAHSPPGTATSPPSTKTPAAVMAPAKKS
jgi:hypothetical protein